MADKKKKKKRKKRSGKPEDVIERLRKRNKKFSREKAKSKRWYIQN